MLPITGVYEVAIPVKDLARAEAFYKGTLELEEGIRVASRKMLFLRAGGNAGMIVLKEDKGEWPTIHFAFTVADADLETAAQTLKEKGVNVSELVMHEWMAARSIYFEDPDGHELELCALMEATSAAETGK